MLWLIYKKHKWWGDYGTLANLSAGYFPVRSRYPRVTHPFAMGLNPFNLHVLGTPPTLILSQDQTLKKVESLIKALKKISNN